MRYWLNLSSIQSRIIRVSSDLSASMRLFCYTFVIGGMLKSTGPVTLGQYEIDQLFLNKLSIPVFLFIILDILQPLIHLFSLQIMHLFKWKKYKKYEGEEDGQYIKEKDKSELIHELNLLEVCGINVFPNLVLFIKTFVVIYLISILVMKFVD